MQFTVTGLSVETRGMTEEQLEQAKLFSGKNAGICYMGESYFDSAVTDPAKAMKRFKSTVNNAHHSIADHIRIEVLFENTSKMFAIVLNSLQDYATSEKSGRYTVMSGNSSEETALYEKWLTIFESRILELYPNYNDAFLEKNLRNWFKKNYEGCDFIWKIVDGKLEKIDSSWGSSDLDSDLLDRLAFVVKTSSVLPSKKLAQENARYVLSVFTYSTTMGYSTSLRQWNYIYDWCQVYISQFTPRYDAEYIKWESSNGEEGNCVLLDRSGCEASYFETRLYFDLLKLSNFIYETMYVEDLRDTKNRCFEFLTQLSGVDSHPMCKYNLSIFEPDGYTGEYNYNAYDCSPDDRFGLTYNTAYTASFVQIAQAERHRTLKYFMIFNPRVAGSEFYIPPMLLGTDLAEEWLKDLRSVEHLVPQATKVCIIETGHISDFILKCKERLCGRAQLEVMYQTKIVAEKLLKYADDAVSKAYLESLVAKNGCIKSKCQMIGCKEGCFWGSSKALDRLV